MKKIILTAITIICIGCSGNSETKNSQKSNINITAEEFTYNGHSYLMLRDRNEVGYDIEHNPDCECMVDSK